IGAEIDKRIDARLAQTGPVQASTAQADSVQAGTEAPAGGPAGYPGFQGYPGYLGPVLPPGYQLGPPPVRPSPVGARNVATTITALGSMALGVAATAIVSSAGSLGGQGFIILLIWVAIAIINVAYARHSLCSRGSPTGRGTWWSWRSAKPGRSATTTSAPSTSCSGSSTSARASRPRRL